MFEDIAIVGGGLAGAYLATSPWQGKAHQRNLVHGQLLEPYIHLDSARLQKLALYPQALDFSPKVSYADRQCCQLSVDSLAQSLLRAFEAKSREGKARSRIGSSKTSLARGELE